MAAVVFAVALSVIGGFVALFSLLPLGMASDGCGIADTRIICSTTGQNVVLLLPLAGLAAGVGMGVVAAARSRSPLYWAGAGWALFIVALVVAYLIAM